MIDWLTVRAAPIEACEHGVAESDLLESTHTGPRSWDRIDYPVGEVFPQSTGRTDGNEFTHEIYTNLYFERSREYDYVDDVLHVVADVIDRTLSALSGTECVINFFPSSIQDFSGELNNTGILLVSIQWEVSTLVDMADAGQ